MSAPPFFCRRRANGRRRGKPERGHAFAQTSLERDAQMRELIGAHIKGIALKRAGPAFAKSILYFGHGGMLGQQEQRLRAGWLDGIFFPTFAFGCDIREYSTDVRS